MSKRVSWNGPNIEGAATIPKTPARPNAKHIYNVQISRNGLWCTVLLLRIDFDCIFYIVVRVNAQMWNG